MKIIISILLLFFAFESQAQDYKTLVVICERDTIPSDTIENLNNEYLMMYSTRDTDDPGGAWERETI